MFVQKTCSTLIKMEGSRTFQPQVVNGLGPCQGIMSFTLVIWPTTKITSIIVVTSLESAVKSKLVISQVGSYGLTRTRKMGRCVTTFNYIRLLHYLPIFSSFFPFVLTPRPLPLSWPLYPPSFLFWKGKLKIYNLIQSLCSNKFRHLYFNLLEPSH